MQFHSPNRSRNLHLGQRLTALLAVAGLVLAGDDTTITQSTYSALTSTRITPVQSILDFAFLASFPHPALGANIGPCAEDPPNSATIPNLSDRQKEYDDAAGAWDDGEHILPYSYWNPTFNNTKSARAAEFFEKFLDDYGTEDSFWCKNEGKFKGPLECFQFELAGEYDFNCRIDNIGLCKTPDPKKIMQHISTRYECRTTEENVALARQVYFTLLNFQHVLSNLEVNYKTFQYLYSKFRASLDTLGEIFTPARGQVKLNQCEILKAVAQIGVEVGVSTAGAALTSATSGVEHYEDCQCDAAAEATTHQAVDRYQQVMELPKFKENLKGLKYTLDLVGVTNRKVWTMYPKVAGVQDISKVAESDGGEKLSLATSTAEGVCGNWLGVVENDNNKNIDSIKDFMTERIGDTLSGLGAMLEMLLNYDEYGDPENLVLRATMSLDFFSKNQKISDQSYTEMKKSIETSMEKLLISKLLAKSRCFVECNDSYQWPTNFQHSLNIYLPEDNSRIACKASCLTNQRYHNKKIPLFGEESLATYDLTSRQLARDSWDHYRAEGNASVLPGAAFRLPVCYSNIRTIENEIMPPLACGDRFDYPETKQFHQDTAIFPTKELRLAKGRIPELLRDLLLPADSYMLLCNLGLQWSQNPWWREIRMSKGPEQCCERMHWETKFLNRHEANHHFCNSPCGARLFKKEVGDLAGHPGVKNSKRKCKRWMDEHRPWIAGDGWRTEIKSMQGLDAWAEEPGPKQEEVIRVRDGEVVRRRQVKWRKEYDRLCEERRGG